MSKGARLLEVIYVDTEEPVNVLIGLGDSIRAAEWAEAEYPYPAKPDLPADLSPAEIDFRIAEYRRELAEGASREEAIDAVLGAYPGSLLLEPEVSPTTVALWAVPLVALVVGAAAAILQAGYSLLRLDRVTITSKAVAFSPLSIPAAGLVAGCGVLMAWRARRWSGRVAALLVATVASWTPMAFGLLVFGAWNVLGARPKLGTAIYAHTFGLLPLPTFAVCAALFVLVARFARRAAPAAPPSGLQTRLGSSGATPE